MRLSWIFVLLLLAGVAVFSVQNAEPMTVRFLVWEATISAALVIQLAAMVGAITGLVVGSLSRRSRQREREAAIEPRPEPVPRAEPAPRPIEPAADAETGSAPPPA